MSGLSKMLKLTDMQRAYIWLAGSYGTITQGRGKRSRRLMYGESDGELFVFGYSTPAYFLEGRGLMKKMQAPNMYCLTDEGDEVFRALQLYGYELTAEKVGVRSIA